MRLLIFAFIVLAGGTESLSAIDEAADSNLPPKAICRLLDKSLGKWSFAYPSREVADAMEKHFNVPKHDLVRAEGDFDGNGEHDCAVLVLQHKSGNETQHLKVFLRMGESYTEFTLISGTPLDITYLQLARKGEKAVDFATNKEFVYEHDTVVLCWFEKAASSYVFKDGKFSAVTTSD